MRLRLFLAFGIIILVTLVGVAYAVRLSAQDEVQTFIGRGGLVGAESLVTSLEEYYQQNGSWEGAPEALMNRGHGQGSGSGKGGQGMIATLRLVDADGRVVHDPVNPSTEGLLVDADLESAITLVADNKTVGYLVPQPGYQVENDQFEQAILERINRASLIAAAIAGAAALLLALLLATFLLRPVRQMMDAAEDLAQGNLSRRVEVRGRHELARLGRAFNNMAGSLEGAASHRREMTADIAHELRTPLAVQRANLEAIQDGVYPPTQEHLKTILEQNALLTRLVEDLRMLALADAGELRLELGPADLSSLIEGIVGRFRAKAEEKGIAIHTNSEFQPTLQIDAVRVEQILHNLLQNALRHTTQSSQVWVNLSSEPGWALIEVRDSGPGIPEEALPHVFERFYRADRYRTRPEGGTGLGLAIARKLAEAHDGTLTAANNPEGGASFTLRLPLD
jgi:two-component system sensor histidine kinase BaeS